MSQFSVKLLNVLGNVGQSTLQNIANRNAPQEQTHKGGKHSKVPCTPCAARARVEEGRRFASAFRGRR